MPDETIEFISAYCDRWCERCAFTTRCSAFRLETAIAMCGDITEGLELALGTPATPDRHDAAKIRPFADLDVQEPAPEELAHFQRQEEARRARLRETPLVALAERIRRVSWEWLTTHGKVLPTVDHLLRDALEIVAHDTVLIAAKTYRAQQGLDRHQHDDHHQHEIQNDWNGSAKVALISVRRSANAWLTIADATGDTTAAELALKLDELRDAIEASFPLATAFVRPGFDELPS